MFRIVLIASLLTSSVALAAPPKAKFDPEAVKREQRINELTAAPASVRNICRGC